MRSFLLGFFVVFALSSCGEPEDGWMFNPGASGSGNPTEMGETVHEATIASSEGGGSGSAPPVEFHIGGLCEQEGGCPCYEFEGDEYPNDSWSCNPDSGIAYDCWVKYGNQMIMTTQQFCTGNGWECGYDGTQPGCWKNSKSSGAESFSNNGSTFTECFHSGICPSGAEILSCYQGPRFDPWDGTFYLFCSGDGTCGQFWKEIEGNKYCICDQQGKADECRSCEEGLMENVVSDPCELYAPEEEELPPTEMNCVDSAVLACGEHIPNSCQADCCEKHVCKSNIDAMISCMQNCL